MSLPIIKALTINLLSECYFRLKGKSCQRGQPVGSGYYEARDQDASISNSHSPMMWYWKSAPRPVCTAPYSA